LHAKLSEINAAKELVRRLPTADQVSAWVEEAKTLPRVITHQIAPSVKRKASNVGLQFYV